MKEKDKEKLILIAVLFFGWVIAYLSLCRFLDYNPIEPFIRR